MAPGVAPVGERAEAKRARSEDEAPGGARTGVVGFAAAPEVSSIIIAKRP